MRRLALLLVLLLPSQALALSGPPPGLAGSLVIVASDASSVTLHAEQTGGSPVTLKLEHYCYANNDQAWQSSIVSFSGSVDATFNIGSFRFHGQIYLPTDCHALLMFYFSGGRAVVLSDIPTFP